LTDALTASLRALPDAWPFTRSEYRAGVINTFKSVAGNVAVIPRLGRRPAIDAAVSEEEWAGSLEITDFWQSLYLRDPELSKKLAGTTSRDTTARMAYDDRALYACFICRQWGQVLSLADASREPDGNVWNDDSVGIVLQPRLADREAYRVICNAERVCYDALGSDASWNGKQELAVRKDEKAKQWIVEMALPWSDFDMRPVSGDVVRCNINRYRNPVGTHWWHHLKISAWTALPFGIDDPPPADMPLGILILE
jgi:hypothetical protein